MRVSEQFLMTLGEAEQMGDRTGMALSLDNLVFLENAKSQAERAMRLAGFSQALKEQVGGEAPPELLLLNDPWGGSTAVPFRGGDAGRLGRGAGHDPGTGSGFRPGESA
ncbi:MAG TPA: hypothetical protein VE737_08240 [Actinomycetota bacterium]|nr:hypothetical protein [Actinomycetota bacterium]